MIVLKLVKVSQKTVQMKTSHLGQFTFCFAHRNCGWTSPRRNCRVRFVQTSIWWWYCWLHCCRNETIRATEEKRKRERNIACNARRMKKRLLVVERKRRCMHCANILAFFSITANFNNTGTFLLNYFVYSKGSVKWYYVFLMYSHLSNQYSYIVMVANSKSLLQNQISRVIVLVQKVKLDRF